MTIVRTLAAGVLALASVPASAQTSQFNLTGVTVYDPSELIGYAASIVAQRSGTVEASDLAEMVELIYREDGHFLAEVFVANDGQTLVVDEGEIGEVFVEGTDERTFRLIRKYMEPVVGRRGITQRQFERSLMLVEDIGSVSASSEITYPPDGGPAVLRLVTQPEDRSFGSATLDHPARELGEAATLTLSHNFLDAVFPGDRLRFEVQGTTEFDSGDNSVWGALTYRAPVGGSGAYGEFYIANVSARRDASGALLATEIAGNTAIAALGYPVVRDVETYGYGLLEVRRSGSDVDVSGTVFESEVEVLGASWIFGKALPRGGAFEYALNASLGRRTSDVAGFDDGDEDFFHLRAGFGYEHPVDWFGPESTVRAEFWGQYSGDRLPGVEEFYLGGRDDERGYAFAEAQGDSGVSATVEVSRDLFPENNMVRRIRPLGFVDVGYAKNNSPSADESSEEFLASLGIGFDAELPADFFVRSYVASPLADGPSTKAGDLALYFGITKSW